MMKFQWNSSPAVISCLNIPYVYPLIPEMKQYIDGLTFLKPNFFATLYF